jgi:hypothetical protein
VRRPIELTGRVGSPALVLAAFAPKRLLYASRRGGSAPSSTGYGTRVGPATGHRPVDPQEAVHDRAVILVWPSRLRSLEWQEWFQAHHCSSVKSPLIATGVPWIEFAYTPLLHIARFSCPREHNIFPARLPPTRRHLPSSASSSAKSRSEICFYSQWRVVASSSGS